MTEIGAIYNDDGQRVARYVPDRSPRKTMTGAYATCADCGSELAPDENVTCDDCGQADEEMN